MPNPNLVIARAGRNSLHHRWLAASNASKAWDLHLCPYEALEESALVGCTSSPVIVGPKWSGLRELLRSWPGWRDYEYIWLPDDDILTDATTIERMFEVANSLGFALCAPALHEASYYAHFVTMRNRRCFARSTGFVEIMAPCFSVQALERLLPTLELSTTGWGWGLDSLWPKLLDYQNVGIIDAAAVLHTRPVGAFRDPDLGRRVIAESDKIMGDYDCRQVHRTFSAFDADQWPLKLDAEGLLATLVDGWSYLYRSSPRTLPWIVEAQRPPPGWPAYPVEGLPAKGEAA
jgi:hypothetical protein